MPEHMVKRRAPALHHESIAKHSPLLRRENLSRDSARPLAEQNAPGFVCFGPGGSQV
ncbi:MAG TPA: hypothetical protein VJS38_03300 [Phenylobacterium sp.]|uniref:hypothetical protein n=1 Tax=Phenylobacterium sp. TaxID=1871053 RepID=UPI002B4AA08A|nr:hypothetical protein [Phenylobacterium sp.]HKR87177.1 hypothetical protein [Phenylobacterium sp.]